MDQSGPNRFELQKEQDIVLFRPEFQKEGKEEDKNEKLWELMGQYLGRDIKSIQKSIITHVEYTLAMTRFNFSNYGCSSATAYSLRDRMIECFNDTNQYYLHNDVKRVYFLSMEFILGRMMQINLTNNDLESNYREALKDIGYDLNQLYEEEVGVDLGYGVLGRIAACSIDSLCTNNIPCWAYGLRYDYGIFRQELQEGEQIEIPDYWLERGNPWEIERPDMIFKIRMYGTVRKVQETSDAGSKENTEKAIWEGGEVVLAMPYDMPVTGYNTFNTNNLRLWRSRPYDEYEESMFPDDISYIKSVEKRQEAEYITSIFYPNDKVQGGKELRLKQQYFYAAATMSDIIRRYQKLSYHKFEDFAKKNSIYLNETHAAIAILEMLRLLIDVHNLKWQDAWNVVYHTFSCGFYTIKETNMEKWPVDLFGKLLPRHLQLIYIINQIFIEKVKKVFPLKEHAERIARMSLIEESQPRQIRIANLCIVACHKIVFCSELQQKVLMEGIFRDFGQFLPKTFILVPNGANPRRWIYNANRKLSKLITEEIGDESEWLTNIDLLKSFESYQDDMEFFEKFLKVRRENKKRFISWLKKKVKFDDIDDKQYINTLFDFIPKRVDENKRQLMCLVYIVYRYYSIKNISDKSKIVSRFIFMGGKTAPSNIKSKHIVKLIYQVSQVINMDAETNTYLRIVFIPNYNASKEYLVVPAADLNEQISLPGEEACTTISEKFIMNGALLLGSKDSTNMQVQKHVGAENITLFGEEIQEVWRMTKQLSNQERANLVCEEFKQTVDQIVSGIFGECNPIIVEILMNICKGIDPFLIGVDFKSYIEAQEEMDRVFQNKEEFCKRTMLTIANCGIFSSDKSIMTLCDKVWDVQPVTVAMPALDAKQRVKSSNNLLASGSQDLLASKGSVQEYADNQ